MRSDHASRSPTSLVVPSTNPHLPAPAPTVVANRGCPPSRHRRTPALDGPILRVVEHHDPALSGAPGVADPAFERFWLPIIGPSAALAVRFVDRELDRHPRGSNLDLDDMATSLGLAFRPGRGCSLERAISRCVLFGLARMRGDALAVRRRIPPLPLRFLDRLPPRLRADYENWEQNPTAGGFVSGTGSAHDGSPRRSGDGFQSPCRPE